MSILQALFGSFGTSPIEFDHLTGPTSDELDFEARFARHTPVRGESIIQDLGNEAPPRKLRFFFDESFCDPEEELAKIQSAFEARRALRLSARAPLGSFIIERMNVKRLKLSPSGRLVRTEVNVELIRSSSTGIGLQLAGLGLAALASPFVRR